jgi:hypothetical protein
MPGIDVRRAQRHSAASLRRHPGQRLCQRRHFTRSSPRTASAARDASAAPKPRAACSAYSKPTTACHQAGTTVAFASASRCSRRSPGRARKRIGSGRPCRLPCRRSPQNAARPGGAGGGRSRHQAQQRRVRPAAPCRLRRCCDIRLHGLTTRMVCSAPCPRSAPRRPAATRTDLQPCQTAPAPHTTPAGIRRGSVRTGMAGRKFRPQKIPPHGKAKARFGRIRGSQISQLHGHLSAAFANLPWISAIF